MKNSADQGGCYPQRPKAKVDNTFEISLRKQLSSFAPGPSGISRETRL